MSKYVTVSIHDDPLTTRYTLGENAAVDVVSTAKFALAFDGDFHPETPPDSSLTASGPVVRVEFIRPAASRRKRIAIAARALWQAVRS